MRLTRLCVSVLSLGMICSAALAAGNDWPGWLGVNRDGKSSDTGLLKQWPASGPKLLWKLNNIGRGFAGVAVANDLVYVAGDVDGKLTIFALDMNGQQKWKAENGPGFTDQGKYPGARSTPTIDDGLLYVFSALGRLACFDATTGQPKWTREASEFGGKLPNWAYAESPLVYKDLVVFTPGGQKTMVALNKKTGQPVWESTGCNFAAHYGSILPVEFEGTTLFVVGTGGGIAGFDAKTGKCLWQNAFSAGNVANCPTPAYANGYIFWANGYNKGGVCLKLKKTANGIAADEVYKTRDLVCQHGGYIIDNGYIYGNHNDGWACIELATGKKMWTDRGIGKGSLCYADGMLYLFAERAGNAALATCSPQGLQIKGKVKVDGDAKVSSWAHPVVIGGRLYLRYDSNLYCFDVKG